MVSVAGRADHVCKAAFVLIETIQADHRTCEHAMTLEYAGAELNSLAVDPLQQMTKHLNELGSQLSLYPSLFAEIRNA
jgi:transaldolase